MVEKHGTAKHHFLAKQDDSLCNFQNKQESRSRNKRKAMIETTRPTSHIFLSSHALQQFQLISVNLPRSSSNNILTTHWRSTRSRIESEWSCGLKCGTRWNDSHSTFMLRFIAFMRKDCTSVPCHFASLHHALHEHIPKNRKKTVRS